jgi:hypothetical protein
MEYVLCIQYTDIPMCTKEMRSEKLKIESYKLKISPKICFLRRGRAAAVLLRQAPHEGV